MNPVRKTVASAALVGAALTGGAVGASFVGTASAQSDSSTTTEATTETPSTATETPSTATETPDATAPAARDESKGGHTANGITETLLTGDDAEKASAAALAAVPGGTVLRVETDAEGDASEAHMTDADGAQVTVKLDANFAVTSIETGR